MRKIVASEYLSLDGVFEEPAWTMPYWSDDLSDYASKVMFAADTLLLGRKTYEGFAAAWPNIPDEDGGAFMNPAPKYVVSNTLEKMEWNASLLGTDFISEIKELKQKDGKNLLIYGSGQLVRALLQHNLIDELHLWIHPTVLGKGAKLFGDGDPQVNLKLANTTQMDTGVIVLRYEPVTD